MDLRFALCQWSNDKCLEKVHIMMMSSNGNIFRGTGPLWGEPPVKSGFPSQRLVTRSFGVFFDMLLKSGWANNRDAGDQSRHRTHHDITIMETTWKAFYSNKTNHNKNYIFCGISVLLQLRIVFFLATYNITIHCIQYGLILDRSRETEAMKTVDALISVYDRNMTIVKRKNYKGTWLHIAVTWVPWSLNWTVI